MSDSIPLIEPVVGEEELANVEEILDSGYLTQGPFVEKLETRFAEYTDSAASVATPSCTTGMELALDALDIGAGDEVIVPDFTYPATATAVVRRGATPVLVDVDRHTYNIDPEAVTEAISPDTAAVMPVSWGGQPLDPEPLRDLATDHDLHIVEDAACAAGASYDGEPVGSQFNASVFSLHPRKVMTTGEGGLVTTDDTSLESTMRMIKNFGTDRSGDEIEFVRADATNLRVSDILGGVGVAQLEKLPGIIDRRRELARRYDELLASVDGIRPPAEPEQATHTYQTYAAYVETDDPGVRDTIIETLAEHDIEAQIGTYALHETEAFADADRTGSLSVSSQLYQRLITLPVAHSMTADDQRRVVDVIDSVLRQSSVTTT